MIEKSSHELHLQYAKTAIATTAVNNRKSRLSMVRMESGSDKTSVKQKLRIQRQYSA